MRVFIACLGTETNTFSSLPTGEQTYLDTALFDGDATRHAPTPFSQPLHIWRTRAEEQGHEVVEGLCAFAQPAGRTIRRVYEDYRDRILAQATAALPLDLVLVNMHGAMVAEGYDDCEGDLLARLREIIGPDTVLGGELDLHCHITPLMLEAATALITYKEYPHIDIGERAEDLFRLCHEAALGRTRPVMAAHDCRMISMWRTTGEQMQAFVADMKAREGRDGVLAVSFGHGFPWGDVAEVGAKTLVVADGDADKAAALAADLAARLWAMREETRPTAIGVDEALDRALAIDGGPVVLADVSDNAGGGAPSDSTFILERLIARGDAVMSRAVSTGTRWRCGFAWRQGRGLGSTSASAASAAPIPAIRWTSRSTSNVSPLAPTRPSAWPATGLAMRCGCVRMAVSTSCSTPSAPRSFTPMPSRPWGSIPPTRRSSWSSPPNTSMPASRPIAAEILYVAAPGAIPPDFAAIPYTKLAKPYWPRVEDPWAA